MNIYVYTNNMFDIVVIDQTGKQARRAAVNELKKKDPEFKSDELKLRGKPRKWTGCGVVCVN